MLDMTPVAEVKEWRLKSLVTYVVKPKPMPCSSALMKAMIQILFVSCQWVYALEMAGRHLHDISCDQVLLGPDLGRRFHLLHAGLGISVNELIVAVVVLGRDRAWLSVGGGFFSIVFKRAGVLETGIVGVRGFALLGLQCSRVERRPKPAEDLSHGSG
jgi:hypothetical protein